MSELIVSGVMGAVVGHTLGAPLIGGTEFRRLNFYEPVPARMAPAPALDAWLVWSNHLRSGRFPEILSQTWLSHWNYPIDESSFGLHNCGRGLGSPLAGSFGNPLSNGSQAFGRAVYWGLVFHGDPERAAEFAYYDASLDHTGEGVHLPVATARMVAMAGPTVEFPQYARVITSTVPGSSRILKALPEVLKLIDQEDGPQQTKLTLAETLGIADQFEATLTMSWILVGLGQLKNGFGAAVRATAGCGGASNHATLVTGTIAGLRAGKADAEWTTPLGTAYVAGHGLRGIEPPQNLSDLASLVVADKARASSALRPIALGGGDLRGDDISSSVGDMLSEEVAPASAATAKDLLSQDPNRSTTEVEGITIAVHYIDPPIVVPGKSNRLQIEFRNRSDVERTLDTQLQGPDGWEVASKMTSFRLRPGEISSFGVVARSPVEHPGTATHLRLRIEKYELLLPLCQSQKWHVAGPFVNHDGNGFDKSYKPETKQNKSEIFSGRSDLAVRWQSMFCPGNTFDVEPHFKLGPGVVYLYGIAKFPKPGKYKVVAATECGIKVWVDQQIVVSYHDVHVPVPRPQAPYVGEFSTTGESKILVKVIRGLAPLGPLSLYFLAEDGKLVVPEEFANFS